MERGGVLPRCAPSSGRSCARSAPGWGGFAYQFKTLFPRATYVIVDFPELFLFSATYSARVFPEARLLFVGIGRIAALDGWRDADFVFVPHTLARPRVVAAARPDRQHGVVPGDDRRAGARLRGAWPPPRAARCSTA